LTGICVAPSAHERQKDHEVLGVIREHDRDAVAGRDAEGGEAFRQTVHSLPELAERDH